MYYMILILFLKSNIPCTYIYIFFKDKRLEVNTPKYYQWLFRDRIMGDNDIYT